jgi:hypothetical protein
MSRLLDGIGIRDGLLDRTEPFHVDSLVALGEITRAREVLVRLEHRGRTIPRLWIDVTLPRARALVLAARATRRLLWTSSTSSTSWRRPDCHSSSARRGS